MHYLVFIFSGLKEPKKLRIQAFQAQNRAFLAQIRAFQAQKGTLEPLKKG